MKNYFHVSSLAILLGFMVLSVASCSKEDDDTDPSHTEQEAGGQESGSSESGKGSLFVVTVDSKGKADGNHSFQQITSSIYYIDNIKYTVENDYLVVSGYNKAYLSGAAVIISTLNYLGRTLHVTDIGENAFRGCTALTSVTIPATVTNIDESAFFDCSGLTSVDIQGDVTGIGRYAFEGCRSLASLTIPASVTRIGDYAFSNCRSLTSVVLPSSVTILGEGAFRGCSGLTSISVEKDNPRYDSRDNCNAIISESTLLAGCKNTTIPGSVTTIGDWAFNGCTGLTSLHLPSSVTEIGGYAFNGCTGLTSVTIPSGVTSIGGYAFNGCERLATVTINSNAIASQGYYSTNSLANIFGTQVAEYVLGDEVTGIGSYAFYGCSGMTTMNIPWGVTSIGFGAFNRCSSLVAITIPGTVTAIGNDAFYGCSSLVDVSIPDGVKSIGGYAFSVCRNLNSVSIGSSVTSIGEGAFYASALEHVYCYAVTPPSTEGNGPFTGFPVSSATLHVPSQSLDAYSTTAPWSDFGTKEALEE